jgi:hypothetical protein
MSKYLDIADAKQEELTNIVDNTIIKEAEEIFKINGNH